MGGQDPSSGAYIYGDETKGAFLGRDLDNRSEAGASAFNSGDMFRNFETREQMAERGNEKKMVEVDDVIVSGSRKRWIFPCLAPDLLHPRYFHQMVWADEAERCPTSMAREVRHQPCLFG